MTPLRPRRRPWLRLAAASLLVTAAGVLWLTAAGNLAATGTRIARLESQREELAQRRARALIAHAAASNPLRLEARAKELGFAPADGVTVLPVGLPDTPAVAAALDPSSPLGLFLTRENLPSTPTQPGMEAANFGLPAAASGLAVADIALAEDGAITP